LIRKITFIGVAVTFGVCALSYAVETIPPAPPRTDQVALDFDNLELKGIIKLISNMTGRNFIIDETIVKGTMTMIGPTKIPVDSAVKVLETILDSKGFTMVPIEHATLVLTKEDALQKEITVVPLKYASAEILGPKILSIVQEGPAAPGARPRIPPRPGARAPVAGVTGAEGVIKIITDERLNSLVIVASKEDTQRVKDLIWELDVETSIAKERVHFYSLMNSKAEDVAAVVTALMSKEKAKEVTTPISVTADKSTNSLIITALPQDYDVLVEIIKNLDRIRSQVLVEVVIAEASLDASLKLGIEWQAGDHEVGDYTAGGGTARLGTGATIDGTTFPPGTLPSALLDVKSSVAPSGFVVGAMETGNPAAFAILHAIKDDSDFNVLSAPHVLTMDNEKASIMVGENVPFLSTRIAQPVTTATTTALGISSYETFESRDVGINLEITPHINQERFVRLEISQKVNEVGEILVGKESRLKEIKRETKTTVNVKDGNTFVIGGLIKNSEHTSAKKVPLLGDIPLLGWLFKTQTKQDKKTNLLVFITPHIVASPEEANLVTRKKSDEIKDMLKGKKKEAFESKLKTKVEGGTLIQPTPPKEMQFEQ
jgi:general secretion pathway protein D